MTCSSLEQAIDVATTFLDKGWASPKDIHGLTEGALKAVFEPVKIKNPSALAEKIKKQSSSLFTRFNGRVPTKRAQLEQVFDDSVTSLLMLHVFGSHTDLVVGLHTKKILTALDMIDWEETGATRKVEVKMVNLSATSVKRSLRTWIPVGETIHFYDTMDSLGRLLGEPKCGDWGRIKSCLTKHLSPKDNKAAVAMLLSINQFYTAVKSGGRAARSHE